MRPLAIQTASTAEERAGAIRLIARVYQRAGYARPGEESTISTWLSSLSATTFLANIGDDLVGTLSIIEDSKVGLPMDSLFKDITDPLRNAGKRLAEIGQFAVDHELATKFEKGFDRAISMSLFRNALRFGLEHHLDYYCITVNPRHENFYHTIGFKYFGETRAYPSVQNAPAVPMLLDFAVLKAQKEKGTYANVITRSLLSDLP